MNLKWFWQALKSWLTDRMVSGMCRLIGQIHCCKGSDTLFFQCCVSFVNLGVLKWVEVFMLHNYTITVHNSGSTEAWRHEENRDISFYETVSVTVSCCSTNSQPASFREIISTTLFSNKTIRTRDEVRHPSQAYHFATSLQPSLP